MRRRNDGGDLPAGCATNGDRRPRDRCPRDRNGGPRPEFSLIGLLPLTLAQ